MAIICLKDFSAVFNKYLEEQELTELFSLILQIFEQTYVLKYDPKDDQWEYLSGYLQAFASYLSYKEITPSVFFCLQRGVINMIKSYPNLHYSNQLMVVEGMVMVLCYMKKTKFFDEFIENVVYQGMECILIITNA